MQRPHIISLPNPRHCSQTSGSGGGGGGGSYGQAVTSGPIVKGSIVSLADGFASHSDASDGPLQPGDRGEVVATDSSGKPLKVKALTGSKVGSAWWYNTAALRHAGGAKVVNPPPTLATPQTRIRRSCCLLRWQHAQRGAGGRE